MEKNLDYYMKLPYTIEVVPIPDCEGGGYMACLPQVGRFALVGDGETIEEAIADLEEVKKQRFSEYLERGMKIPEPFGPDAPKYCPRFKPKSQNCFIGNRRGVSRRHDDDNHAIEYHSYRSGIY